MIANKIAGLAAVACLAIGAPALATKLGPDGERGVHHAGRFIWFEEGIIGGVPVILAST